MFLKIMISVVAMTRPVSLEVIYHIPLAIFDKNGNRVTEDLP